MRAWWIVTCTLLGLPLTLFMASRGFIILFGPPTAASAAPMVVRPMWDTPPPAGLNYDDACQICSPDDMCRVELRVRTNGVSFIGHAFITTPTVAVGFRTDEEDIGLVDYLFPFAASHPGYIRDDQSSRYDFVLTYRVCPQTLERLMASIFEHGLDPYQVGNWRGGRNCATWAADRLADAGLRPPPGDCPNRMARSMIHVSKLHDAATPAVMVRQ